MLNENENPDMKEKTVNEILLKAIKKMSEQEARDESWKKEAMIALDQRIAAFNKLTYLSLYQQPYLN